ncbi:MAG: collagen-like protein [Candidatus Thioglobus sp.]|nr:collagen-like protein [Candidatus Thioglobus sp.]
MGFPTNPTNNQIRTHADGRRWQFKSAKGAWRIKKTVVDDSNFTGPTGATGSTGATGAQGAQGETGEAGSFGSWTLEEDSSGVLCFLTDDVIKMELDGSGNLKSLSNITAFGSM